ncbi:MAG: hypothetical protein F6J90_11635 [Moorea sp. SIOASIH]|uniref:hypothetical protein n=1 Tax=Moorena sp. SIOASIH TaxID=2607817 RepID=UPI0013BDA764|nr:hypothetical protein [Moorena sp. SIOASIH]NEO36924.1 hypothetical protein [Moorena sp. SIOASIH]
MNFAGQLKQAPLLPISPSPHLPISPPFPLLPYSLLPTPYSLKPKRRYLIQLINGINNYHSDRI